MKPDPLNDALYRVKRGLAGYVSYLAACEMNQSFSEYILYEPTLRILTAQGWLVQCEYPCPGYDAEGLGDFKRLDFVATCPHGSFAIEMKWIRKSNVDVCSDVEKLKKYVRATAGARGFLCVFGRKSHIEYLTLGAARVREHGQAIYAEFGVTRYGCRNYEVTDG